LSPLDNTRPGVGGDIPLFARNQGVITRAAAELGRASRTYLAVRLQVTSEVRSAFVRVNQTQQALQIRQSAIVSSLETEQRQAESAYKLGEVALSRAGCQPSSRAGADSGAGGRDPPAEGRRGARPSRGARVCGHLRKPARRSRHASNCEN
jgi:hypothetical protein